MASNWRCAFLRASCALFAAWLGAANATAKPADRSNPELQACIDTHESAQLDVRRADFLLARWKLDRCASPRCPTLIRDDCASLKRQLLPRIPSIVPAATDPKGRELVDVAVWIDGVRVLERLDGSALQVNPGEHELKLETAAGTVVRRRIRVEEGVKSQLVRVAFGQRAEPAAPPSAQTSAPSTMRSSAPEPREKTEQGRASSIPTPAYVLAGGSALAFVSWGIFGIRGLSGKAELEECRPDCAKDDVAAVRSQLLVADLSFAAGMLAAAGAAYFVFGPPSGNKDNLAQPRAVGVTAKADAARAEVVWSF